MISVVNKEQMDYFWRKKEFVSFVLCILVFFIHISSFAPYIGGEDAVMGFNEKLSFFFKESITRFAVPMYYILSGITFFRDYSNKRYIHKVKTRFFTLCIPYLIWNTLCMLFDIICSYTFISSFLSGRKLFVMSLGNILNGILLHGSNIPFWYILYLIIFVLLSPLFDLIIRNKYVGIVSIIVLSVLSILKIGSSYGLNYDAIVFYLLGALIGKHYFETVTRKTSRICQTLSGIFLIIYIVAKNLFPVNEYLCVPFVKIVIFILASGAMWSISDLFIDKILPHPIYGRSFPIFVMHTNVSAIVYKVLYLIFPKNGYFGLPNFMITVILTLAIINVCCIIFERYLPRTYALFMGKGIKKQIEIIK